MATSVTLGAVHTHTHTGRRLNNHILSCSKINNKNKVDM